MENTLTTAKQIVSRLDLIRARPFQFALQKFVIFITMFVASFLVLWNFEFFTTSFLASILTNYPTLIWKFFMIFTLYLAAMPLTKSIAESYNRTIDCWFAILILIAFAAGMVIFSEKITIVDKNSVRLVHFAWLIPSIVLQIGIKVRGIFMSAKLSPIQAYKMVFSLFSALFSSAIFVCGVLLFDETIIKGKQFDLGNWEMSLLFSLEFVCFAFMVLFEIIKWLRYRKITFNSLYISTALLVIMPIFAAVLVWVFKGVIGDFNLNDTSQLWFFAGCVILVMMLVLFTLLFAKEIKSTITMNAIFATALAAVWIGSFVYMKYFGVQDSSYIVVNLTASASLVIFIMMALFDKVSKANFLQETLFTWMILIIMALFLLFTIVGKAKLFDELSIIGPIDFQSLLPVLMIIMPGIYFVIAVGKIIWSQLQTAKGVAVWKKIQSRKAKAAFEKQEEKHV